MNFEKPQDLFDALCDPFPHEYIDWRIGSTNADKTKGMALAYVDARTVADRFDTVCGIEGWQNNYTPGGNGSIVCNIGVLMPDGSWVWKADGAGATDVEAEKGMLSDAFKRAAVKFGVARYLYELKAPWVPIEQRGRSHVIPDTELRRLNEMHDEFAQSVQWGVRSGYQAYRLLRKIVAETVTQPADVISFQERHKGEIALLPAGMRKNLSAMLERVGVTEQEAA